MSLLIDQTLPVNVARTYHIQIPTNPTQAALPVIIVFHGGGQDAATIAARWGVSPPDPVPVVPWRTTCWCFPRPIPRCPRSGCTSRPVTALSPRTIWNSSGSSCMS